MPVENTSYQADLLWEASAGSNVFVTLGSFFEITPPEIGSDPKEITKLNESARWRKFRPSAFLDPGEVSGMLRFDATEVNTIMGYLNQVRRIRVRFNDHDTTANRSYVQAEEAFITGFGVDTLALDSEGITAKLKLKMSGTLTFSPRVP